MKRILSRLVQAAAIVIPALGQVAAQSYSFKTYGIEHGLKNSATNCLAQDSEGYLWVGTQNGLFRYDGTAFRPVGDLETLGSLDVQALASAPDGSVWLGTRRGIARLRKGHLKVITVSARVEITGNSGLAVDTSGRLYASSAAGLLRLVSQGEGVFREEWISRKPAGGVQVQADGSVWYGCGSDVCRLDPGGAVAQLGSRLGLPQDSWGSFLVDQNGDCWIRSAQRLYVWRRGAGRAMAVDPGRFYSNVAAARLVMLPDGRVAIPTDEGLAIAAGKHLDRVSSATGLTGDTVGAVLVDRESSVWVAVRGVGVSRWLGPGEWESWTKKSGMLHDTVWAIRRDLRGNLWVGTSAGVSVLAKGSARWRHITPREGLSGARARAIAADSRGTVWVGTSPGRLVQFDTTGRNLRSFGPESGLTESLLQGILEDDEGALWVSTSQGLFRSLRPGGERRFERVRVPGVADDARYYQAVLDKHGRLWIPSSEGALRYDHGQWRRFGASEGLRSDAALAVAAGPQSYWVVYAEPRGLSRLTFKGDQIKVDHFDQRNGLRSNKIYSMAVDRRGWVWVGTDAGVDVLRAGEWSHYGRDSGLVWDDCDTNGMYPDNDGSVWIGTSGGLAHYLPTASAPSRHTLETILTRIKIGGVERSGAGNPSVSHRDAAFLGDFSTLSFLNEDRVRFRYRMLGLDDAWRVTDQRQVEYPKLPPGNYTFEVETEPRFESQVSTRAGFSFAVLPPWWNTWWALAAGVALLAGLIVLAWRARLGLILARQHALEAAIVARTRELEEQIRAKQEAHAKLAEAQQGLIDLSRRSGMAEVATGVLHNVGNVLNSVNVSASIVADKARELRFDNLVALAGMLQEHSANLPEFLGSDAKGQRVLPYLTKLGGHLQQERQVMLRELAQLTDHIGHIKAIVATQQNYARVSGLTEVVSLPGLVEDAIRIVQAGFERHQIQLERDYEQVPPVSVDKHSVLQILLNLLRNAKQAIKDGSNPDRRIRVRICGQGEDRIRVSVTDTGVGLPPENLTKIFSHGFTTRRDGHGFGLHSGANSARQMGGALWAESNGPGQGATFTLELPLRVRETVGGRKPQ